MMASYSSKNQLILGIVALLCFCLVAILDIWYLKIPLLGDIEAPTWSWGHIIRSIILLVSAFAAIYAINGRKKTEIQWSTYKNIPYEKFSVLVVLAGAAFNIVLFMLLPKIFNRLTLEDGVIENFSALLLFGGSFTGFMLLWKLKAEPGITNIIKFSVFLLSILLFIIAMEEVSWFQRQLKIDVQSSDFFKSNEQLEMNFHNFFSIAFEYLYYTGTFLFFVVVPYINMIFPKFSQNRFLQIFIARPYIAIIGTVGSVYNYEKWDSILTQIAVFASIFILIKLSQSINISKAEKRIIRLNVVLIIATQLLFLIFGSRFARYWEVTEFKEFYIAILLFLYPLSIWAQINRETQEQVS